MSRPDGTLDFGGTLRRLREARGVALRDIADTTKVSVSALEALERNDVSRLPGGIFRRGIIRAYAGTIGADPEQLVRDFDAQFPREGPAARFPRSSSSALRGQGSRRLLIVAAVVVPLAAILAWSLFFLT
jgi:cytoskeletal protein RodZ